MKEPGHTTVANPGLEEALRYPLFSAILHRRSRRISKGIGSVPAGSLTYTSPDKPQPLSPLEEAVLIGATGITGWTMPDLPLQTPDGQPLLGSPMIALAGRAASSPDNAQGTHFFLLNDSGTYLLRRPPDLIPLAPSAGPCDPEQLIASAEACKVRLLDKRLDFPRQYPFYLGRNRFVSNLAGSTILVPVVDLTKQYINGLMFLLSGPDGQRPAVIDDWNFYRKAGVAKWVRNGFLNKDLPLPLGLIGTLRTQVEAELLIQNLLLVIQAMGLGGWVHAAFPAPALLGAPGQPAPGGGLRFRFHTPRPTLWRRLRKVITPMPAWEPNPVGLDGLLEGYCPPYHKTMSDAVDAVLALKYGPGGLYTDPAQLEQVFRPNLAQAFVQESHHYTPEVIDCVKDICNYIHDTYDRFPAHVDAIYVPGIWVQAHHLDLGYYDQLFRQGYSETQAHHQHLWHPGQ
jgi:hypothetical protein